MIWVHRFKNETVLGNILYLIYQKLTPYMILIKLRINRAIRLFFCIYDFCWIERLPSSILRRPVDRFWPFQKNYARVSTGFLESIFKGQQTCTTLYTCMPEKYCKSFIFVAKFFFMVQFSMPIWIDLKSPETFGQLLFLWGSISLLTRRRPNWYFLLWNQ